MDERAVDSVIDAFRAAGMVGEPEQIVRFARLAVRATLENTRIDSEWYVFEDGGESVDFEYTQPWREPAEIIGLRITLNGRRFDYRGRIHHRDRATIHMRAAIIRRIRDKMMREVMNEIDPPERMNNLMANPNQRTDA